MTTVKEHIERMQKTYRPEDAIAVPVWTVDDVLGQAKERGMEITREQAEEILHYMHRKHNATLGISWDTIDACLDDL